MKKIITCLLATFGLATGCCQQNFKNTDPEGFAELTAKPGVVLLDVRTAAEYKEGHIENAVNIDVKQDDFMDKAKALPKDKTIAVYCRSGRRSATAAGLMASEGYKVVNLVGGITAWKDGGRPVTTATRGADAPQTGSGRAMKSGADTTNE